MSAATTHRGDIVSALAFLRVWYNNLYTDESIANDEHSPALQTIVDEGKAMSVTVMLMNHGETVNGKAYQITRTDTDYIVTVDQKGKRI